MAIKIQGGTVIFDDKVFRPAQLTTLQRDAIASPLSGMLIYNTDTTFIEGYNGSAWVQIGGSDNFARTVAFLGL
jgi:predicted chitinase